MRVAVVSESRMRSVEAACVRVSLCQLLSVKRMTRESAAHMLRERAGSPTAVNQRALLGVDLSVVPPPPPPPPRRPPVPAMTG